MPNMPPPKLQDYQNREAYQTSYDLWVRTGSTNNEFGAAPYITKTAHDSLTAEFALGQLDSGYLKVTTITGEPASQVIPIPLTDGGTGGTSASAARTSLGLGTLATQAASAVAITGGTIDGTTITGGSVLGVSALASGTYTPTLTNVTNIDSTTAYDAQYLRVGSVVTVSGELDLNPTVTPADTEVGISLPIASNLAQTYQLGGTANSFDVISEAGTVRGDAANNRASLRLVTNSAATHKMTFIFTYLII